MKGLVSEVPHHNAVHLLCSSSHYIIGATMMTAEAIDTAIDLGRFLMFSLGMFVVGGSIMLLYRSFNDWRKRHTIKETRLVSYHIWVSITFLMVGGIMVTAAWIGRRIPVSQMGWSAVLVLATSLRALYIGSHLTGNTYRDE